jgi:hypothetical protein
MATWAFDEAKFWHRDKADTAFFPAPATFKIDVSVLVQRDFQGAFVVTPVGPPPHEPLALGLMEFQRSRDGEPWVTLALARDVLPIVLGFPPSPDSYVRWEHFFTPTQVGQEVRFRNLVEWQDGTWPSPIVTVYPILSKALRLARGGSRSATAASAVTSTVARHATTKARAPSGAAGPAIATTRPVVELARLGYAPARASTAALTAVAVSGGGTTAVARSYGITGVATAQPDARTTRSPAVTGRAVEPAEDC